MGWASGTDYFDGALDIFLPYIPKSLHDSLIEKWYSVIAEGDWDTEEESNYYDKLEPILRKKFPHWFDDEGGESD